MTRPELLETIGFERVDSTGDEARPAWRPQTCLVPEPAVPGTDPEWALDAPDDAGVEYPLLANHATLPIATTGRCADVGRERYKLSFRLDPPQAWTVGDTVHLHCVPRLRKTGRELGVLLRGTFVVPPHFYPLGSPASEDIGFMVGLRDGVFAYMFAKKAGQIKKITIVDTFLSD